MTGPKTEKVMAIYKGFAKDTDPVYQEGYTVIVPKLKKSSAKPSKDKVKKAPKKG